MKKYFSAVILCLSLISCSEEVEPAKETVSPTKTSPETEQIIEIENDSISLNPKKNLDSIPPLMGQTIPEEITYETFYTENLGWGYRILKDGHAFVNQPHIPAIQGKRGFSTEEKAQTTAKVIANKVKNGISPPTISLDELEELGVLD